MMKAVGNLGQYPDARVSAAREISDVTFASDATETLLGHHQRALITKIIGQQTAFIQADEQTTVTHLSEAGSFIDHVLKKAANSGSQDKIIAQQTLTQTPTFPAVMAQELQEAIGQSGLFYESHLKAHAEGHFALKDLMSEPQNRMDSGASQLLPLQLHVAEHQSIAWSGEVWPGQTMNWQLQVEQDDSRQDNQPAGISQNGETISSDISLHLPRLGRVSARLQLMDGHLHISVTAQTLDTFSKLKQHSQKLTDAIAQHGQVLSGLKVLQDA